ncbi:hypothetical protein P280DRAFT_414800, partial [Massarina eburnea CBS 473.64]
TGLKNLLKGIVFTLGRTYNCSRSLSQQNRSVTLGKGLALRVRCVRPWGDSPSAD